MRGLALTEGNLSTLFSSLGDFCVDSVSTCLSRDADSPCVPVGLGALSALLLLLSCFLLVCQRCRCRRGDPGEILTFSYSLLGHLCATVGAVLSRQLHIQVLLGAVAAAVDAVHLISCSLPVLLCWNSQAERRLRMMRRRRRQRLLVVCVLTGVAGGFLKSSRLLHPPGEVRLSGRRLLHITLRDNTEILGYVLGLLSLVIACTSRFPGLRRASRGQMLTRAQVFSALLCSLAGALYASALLLYDAHFGFLLRVMPWLLSGLCCAAVDLLILIIHGCKRGTRGQLTCLPPDAESLLSGSHTPTEGKAVVNRQKKHPSARTKSKKGQKMTEMGRYMDVSVQPARKLCLKEVASEGELEGQLLGERVRVIRVDSSCSSDTSYESSVVSSDLEIPQTSTCKKKKKKQRCICASST